MNLRKLQDKLVTNNSGFLSKYQNTNLNECKTVDEAINNVKNILKEADEYAKINKLEYKYLQMAKNLLWEDIKVKPEPFIYQGFDAQVEVDLSENIDDIKLFVTVQNNNVSALKEGQRIEITDEFVNGMNDLQKSIFEEAYQLVQQRTLKTINSVWKYEQARIDKWVKTCGIKLKGN